MHLLVLELMQLHARHQSALVKHGMPWHQVIAFSVRPSSLALHFDSVVFSRGNANATFRQLFARLIQKCIKMAGVTLAVCMNALVRAC